VGSNEQDKKSKPAKGGKGLSGEKDRGTQDDIEILKLILDENPALRQRVLDKMRAIRKMNKL
jgi:hypothetical protein